METIARWTIIITAVLTVIGLIFLFGLDKLATDRLDRTYDVQLGSLTVSTNTEAIARGEHLVNAVANCHSCHGADLAGGIFMDRFPIGRIVAGNLTGGSGGIGQNYTASDWVRTLRHGIGPTGRSLLPLMPSDSYRHLSDRDLGAVVAYLQTLTPVDNELPSTELTIFGRILFGSIASHMLHATALAQGQSAAVSTRGNDTFTSSSVEVGAYLVEIGSCRHCHGADLRGGQVEPQTPSGPDITRAGVIAIWNWDNFVQAMRTGTRADGTSIDAFMPWYAYRNMQDEELRAIWDYLQTLPSADVAQN